LRVDVSDEADRRDDAALRACRQALSDGLLANGSFRAARNSSARLTPPGSGEHKPRKGFRCLNALA